MGTLFHYLLCNVTLGQVAFPLCASFSHLSNEAFPLFNLLSPFLTVYDSVTYHSVGYGGVAGFQRVNLILPFPLKHIFYLLPIMFAAGFRLNASSWPMFLLKTLNGAEMAPIRIFHKVRCPSDITNSKLLKVICLYSFNYLASDIYIIFMA